MKRRRFADWLEPNTPTTTTTTTHVDDVARLGGPRLCRAYDLARLTLERLRVPDYPVDLDAQAQLTNQLSRARPRYETVAEEDVPGAIQTKLGVPISLLASGPSSHDVIESGYMLTCAGR